MLYDETVYTHGLKVRPDLNGRAGRICGHEMLRGRYQVQFLTGGEKVNIKPENLAPLNRENVDSVGLPLEDRLDFKLMKVPGLVGTLDMPSRDMPSRDVRIAPLESVDELEDRLANIRLEIMKDAGASLVDPQASRDKNVRVARKLTGDRLHTCRICGAQRPLAYKCCGFYCGV